MEVILDVIQELRPLFFGKSVSLWLVMVNRSHWWRCWSKNMPQVPQVPCSQATSPGFLGPSARSAAARLARRPNWARLKLRGAVDNMFNACRLPAWRSHWMMWTLYESMYCKDNCKAWCSQHANPGMRIRKASYFLKGTNVYKCLA